MKDRLAISRLFSKRLARILFGVVVIALLGTNCISICSAQSVEKSETSQQAKKTEDELQLAREAEKSPGEEQKPNIGLILGDYTVMSSMEMGYRFVDTDGSRATYLSDVNVRDGWRLFDFSMDARSISGNAPLFDFLRMDVSNAGGDQGQYISIRADKAFTYKFDGTVRRFNYFRALPEFIEGNRSVDNRRQLSDFNLKLFPQRPVRINIGYSRSGSKGPFLTTYDYERDEFVLDGSSKWVSNDYRLGADMSIRRWNIFFEQMFRNYRDDSTYFQRGGFQAGNPTTQSFLTSLFRDEPTRTDASITRLDIRGDITSRAHLVLRGLYSNENLEANQVEQTSGKDASGNAIISRRILTTGKADRPTTSADALFTYDVADWVSVSNSFRFISYRILGDLSAVTKSVLQQPTGTVLTPTIPSLDSRFTGVASYWNTIQANFNFGTKLTARVGLRSTYRDITIRKLKKDDETEQQATNTLVTGLRYRPTKRASLFFDYEEGRTDNAFVRINPLDFRQFRVRTSFQVNDKLSFDANFISVDRTNPTPQAENESDSRAIAVSANWEPNSRVYLSGGYDYNYYFSTADIFYFSNFSPRRGRSMYYARQDSIFIDSRFALTKRLDLLFVYRYTGDRGEPGDLSFKTVLGPNDFISALPIKRHNPEVRLAYRFSNHFTGNISYRHYSYNEREAFIQDYRANILTTTMRFTF
jgi:hypothetical protein